jgi:hypothetical protein
MRGLNHCLLVASSAPTGRRLLPVPGESGAVVQGAGLTRRRGPHARLEGGAGVQLVHHRPPRRSMGCRQSPTPDQNRRSGVPARACFPPGFLHARPPILRW